MKKYQVIIAALVAVIVASFASNIYYDHDRNVKMCEDIEDKVVVIDNEYVHIADVWYDNGINAYRITFEVIDDAYRENGHVGGKFVAFGSYNMYTRNQLMKQYNELKELDNVI